MYSVERVSYLVPEPTQPSPAQLNTAQPYQQAAPGSLPRLTLVASDMIQWATALARCRNIDQKTAPVNLPHHSLSAWSRELTARGSVSKAARLAFRALVAFNGLASGCLFSLLFLLAWSVDAKSIL